MNADRRSRIEAFFEAAVVLPPDERPGWLAAACGEDQEILDEVLALLAAHGRANGILDSDGPGSAFDAQAVAAHDEDGFAPPDAPWDEADVAQQARRLGPWRILREIASGGMGTVYLAERADGLFRQSVALKVVKSAFFTEEMHRRFTNERQILATLNHPNIARLFGGGRTPEGRPYLAMEYVDGLPVHEYCERNAVALEERLRLTCTVARAVHYAHRNLVVHRDLKPSNILVEADGTPKLLDFGIAKILDPGAVGATGLPATLTGERLMTPEYASPEQVRGGTITTATDVYGLGVILYELLTGRRPFILTADGLTDLERRIVEQDPERPSSLVARLITPSKTDLPAAAPVRGPPAEGGSHLLPHIDAHDLHHRLQHRRLRQQLRGDVDRIVLMALRKEPERRYASAEAFAEDIERHLKGLPVVAARPSRRYRAGKFIRRNRVQTVAGAAVVLALATGAAVSTWQARRAERALDDSEEALARSEDVTSLLLGMFEASDPLTAGADTAVAREIMRRGHERVEQLDGQPLVQAELLHALGRVHYNLGRYEESLELFERSLELRLAGLGPSHPKVAESLERVAWLRRSLGDLPAADSMLGTAYAIVTGSPSTSDLDLVPILRGMARIATTRGQLDSAAALHRRVLAIETAAYGSDYPDLAYNLHRLAGNYRFRGMQDSALALYREALDIRHRGNGPESREVAEAKLLLADQLQLGDTIHFTEAEQLYTEALALQRQVFGPDYPNLSHGLEGLAGIANRRERFAQGEDYLLQVLDLRLRTLGPDNANVGSTYKSLGDQRARMDDWSAAMARYRQARPILIRHLGENPTLAALDHSMAIAFLALEQPDSALDHANLAYRIWETTLGRNHRSVAEALVTRSRAYGDLGRLEEAERDLIVARRSYDAYYGSPHASIEEVDSLLADLRAERANTAERSRRGNSRAGTS